MSFGTKLSPRDRADLALPPRVEAELELAVSLWRTREERSSKGERRVARGLTCLFVGPPGSGKTKAAQALAQELGMDVCMVDIAKVASKYVGETEKNLDRVFEEAGDSTIIFFFDEAAALFGKRTEVKDAHDRYANLEIDFLLQRMERHDGLVILATNLRATIDGAFRRRFVIAVEFPTP